MANYSNNLGQIRLGWRTAVSTTPVNTNDVDATSFITAAGITDTTQISALNTLVNDLKTYGLWTKMKAVYPFVGGSAASHKWNLKDPRDLDAAYRLVFNGGWTHTSTGAKPNGTTGYADTKLIPSVNISNVNSVSISNYSITQDTSFNGVQIGCYDGSNGQANELNAYQYYSIISRKGGSSYQYSIEAVLSTETNTKGFLLNSRTSSSIFKLFFNNNLLNTNTTIRTGNLPTRSLYIGASNWFNGTNQYSPHEHAFDSIGDGLTDTEASNFYISVQKFQTTLGRHVGTPYVSDPDAIAFLMAAGITDGTQAAAINTLVIRMKADGVWTKMKAIYPFVGGNATSHKFNLKDPRDLDAAYRLVFNGGWTHTGTGAKPNGTTGYANTYLNPPSDLLANSGFGWYSITNNNTTSSEMGAMYYDMPSATNVRSFQVARNSGTIYVSVNSQDFQTFTDNDTRGFYQSYRTDSSTVKTLKNRTLYTTTLTYYPMVSMYCYIGARNERYIPQVFSDKCLSFAYFQSNFTDNDATALYSAVQAFQTTLGRQTDVPLVSDTDAQAFLNAANITSFQQASAVNKLVIDLKASGVWTKMKAIYPFVGGSADSHKFNLKDPRDLDAAFRLVFNGGWTHTGTGALPNGTTGYADTKMNANSTNFDYQSMSATFYSRTNNNLGVNDIGVQTGGNKRFIELNIKEGNLSYMALSHQGISYLNFINNDSRGFYHSNRIDSNTIKLYKNGTNVASGTQTSTDIYGEYSVYISALNARHNNNQVLYFSNREVSFTTLGSGLTDAEATALYTAVETYQTSLGRGVNTPIYNNGLVLNLDAGNANSYPGTGTTWFDLASGNNGTLVNGPTYDFNNGGSLYFDGTNKYTDISYTKINITNKLTINAWVYFLSQPSTSGNPNIVDKWDWPNNKRAFSLGTENGYLSTSISYDGLFDNRIVCSDNSSIILNQWINITMTYDGRTLKLYKNGSLIQSSSFSQDRNIFSDITTNIFLGRSRGTEGSSRHLNARISGVQIYSNSLTSTEILNNFNSTRGRFGL